MTSIEIGDLTHLLELHKQLSRFGVIKNSDNIRYFIRGQINPKKIISRSVTVTAICDGYTFSLRDMSARAREVPSPPPGGTLAYVSRRSAAQNYWRIALQLSQLPEQPITALHPQDHELLSGTSRPLHLELAQIVDSQPKHHWASWAILVALLFVAIISFVDGGLLSMAAAVFVGGVWAFILHGLIIMFTRPRLRAHVLAPLIHSPTPFSDHGVGMNW